MIRYLLAAVMLVASPANALVRYTLSHEAFAYTADYTDFYTRLGSGSLTSQSCVSFDPQNECPTVQFLYLCGNYCLIVGGPGAPEIFVFRPNIGTDGLFVSFTTPGISVIRDYIFAVDVIPDPVAGVPEPGQWALMLAGFVLVGAALRRRATRVGGLPLRA